MEDFTSSVTTRMRRAFKYPEDSEIEHETREELDEEEQDKVIKELRKQDEKWNAVYKLIFTILPFVSAASFVPSLLDFRNTAYQKFLCILSMASLLATAYSMKYNHTVGPAPKGNKPMRLTKADDPPAGNRIPLVNTGVCVFLAIAGYLMSAGADLAGTTIWLLYLAPGVVFGIVMIVQRESLSVDIRELEGLRYEYKGA